MAHYLGQIELGGEVRVEQVVDLTRSVGMRVGPPTKGQRGILSPKQLAQLPRVLDRAGRTNGLVAAKHHQRGKSVLPRALRVGQAVLLRVLRRHEWDDARARDVVAEIGDEVPEVVFFGGTDGAVCEEDVGAFTRKTLDRVVRIDPRVHAFGRLQLCARGPEFCSEHRRAVMQGGEEVHGKVGRAWTVGTVWRNESA